MDISVQADAPSKPFFSHSSACSQRHIELKWSENTFMFNGISTFVFAFCTFSYNLRLARILRTQEECCLLLQLEHNFIYIIINANRRSRSRPSSNFLRQWAIKFSLCRAILLHLNVSRIKMLEDKTLAAPHIQ